AVVLWQAARFILSPVFWAPGCVVERSWRDRSYPLIDVTTGAEGGRRFRLLNPGPSVFRSCKNLRPLIYTDSPGASVEIFKSILLIVSALFPIVNPLGGSPVFLALSSDYPRDIRFVLARKVAINSFFLMVASFLVGTHILRFFGISIPVVQVGGGLIVVANGWALLSQKDQPERAEPSHRNVNPTDIFRSAFYPLTMPLTVGPGSISVAITL